MSSGFSPKKAPDILGAFTILRNLVAALLAVCCTRLIYHSAGVAADTHWLLIHHRLTVGLTLHWLTVLLVGVLRLVWIHWLIRVHRLTVGVAALERRAGHIGTGHADDDADKTEEESAAEPASEALVAFAFHNIASDAAHGDGGDKAADKNADKCSFVIVAVYSVYL